VSLENKGLRVLAHTLLALVMTSAPAPLARMHIKCGQRCRLTSPVLLPLLPTRDNATPDNPPVLLPCNHVLCLESVLKIAKGRTRTFKCPYCPMDARADNLRTLTFPDVD